MRQCKVYVHDVEAGILQETDAKEYVFTYEENYHGEPVCLAMPVRKEPYRSAHLFPYFYNMLSEGANRRMQSMLLHIDEQDDFGILIATAQTDTIGSLTVKPIGQDEG
jgi:serine/threonine-protein kinase HipA